MKTSNKLLLITAAALCASTVMIITGMGIYFKGNSIPLGGTEGGPQKTTTRVFQPGAFTGVRAGGTWTVEVVRSDACSLAVTAPEALMGFIRPGVAGGILKLDQWFIGDPGEIRLKAVVSMPDLSFLEAGGSSNVKFSGFTCGKLDVRALDTGRVEGSGSTAGELSVKGTGTAKIDLHACPAVNATLDLLWTGEIAIAMNGGKLGGKIAGNSKFTWSGTVREMDLETTAIVKIIKTPAE
jgi:hypothetical protein